MSRELVLVALSSSLLLSVNTVSHALDVDFEGFPEAAEIAVAFVEREPADTSATSENVPSPLVSVF